MRVLRRVSAPGEPPAVHSTRHQQWEAPSIHRDLDSALMVPELCLALGWSCQCHQLPAVEHGPSGCGGRTWATLGAVLGASSPPRVLALHVEELPGERQGLAGPSQPRMVSWGGLGGQE